MRFDRHGHRRRPNRAPEYDYGSPGAYFVTICTKGRECVFGDVSDSIMHLNGFGEIVREEWLRTAELRSNVELDAFVVMPNHVHGIIIITETLEDLATGATQRVAPTERDVPAVGATGPVAPSPRGPKSGSLGAIVGQFKSVTAKRINRVRGTPGAPIWQRNYYDHIIRDEPGLDRIRDYIAGNTDRWLEDALHPSSR